MSVTIKRLSEAVEQNASRVSSYRSGGTGKDGTCDCIGLIMGALALLGQQWKGKHGTNYTVRNMLSQKTSDVPSGLSEGMLVFKYHNPGESGYDAETVQKYINQGSADKRDYYHVGYVLSVNPLHIIHCTSPGPIVHDYKIGKWRIGGWLKMVTHNDTQVKIEVMSMKALVQSDNGKGVNIRSAKDTGSKLVEHANEGTSIEILEYGDTWSQVKYNGKTGFAMTRYLQTMDIDESAQTNVDASSDTLTLRIDHSTCLKLYDACAAALGIGVG